MTVPKLRVRQHIDPWRRSHFAASVVVMMYSRPSGVNPPIPLKKIRSERGDAATAAGSGRWTRAGGKLRNGDFFGAAAQQLVHQRSAAIRDDGASDRLEQNAVLARYLVPRSHEDAARSICQGGFDPCGNQSRDLVLQNLPVAGVIFVPDQQVHRQSF